MKKAILILSILFFGFNSYSQTHLEKLQVAQDAGFKAKVIYAAYEDTKALIADSTAPASVKRFSQIIISSVANLDDNIITGLGYYLQSIPATVHIDIKSSQQDISFGMPFVFSLFAKAWYKDVQ